MAAAGPLWAVRPLRRVGERGGLPQGGGPRSRHTERVGERKLCGPVLLPCICDTSKFCRGAAVGVVVWALFCWRGGPCRLQWLNRPAASGPTALHWRPEACWAPPLAPVRRLLRHSLGARSAVDRALCPLSVIAIAILTPSWTLCTLQTELRLARAAVSCCCAQAGKSGRAATPN